ncbi:MAG: hypothetical protein J6J61_02880 [Muribaculaceae bacterium]|nr:hypothetical protein [Muribaculaceae bacterium]
MKLIENLFVTKMLPVCFVAASAAAGGLQADAYDKVSTEDGEFSIELVEFNPEFYNWDGGDILLEQPFIVGSPDKFGDFVVAGNYLFFGGEGVHVPKGSAPYLTRIDGVNHNASGTAKGAITQISAGDYSLTDCYPNYVYVGTDTAGNAYMSTPNTANGLALLVFPLEIDADGNVAIVGRYQLEVEDGMFAGKVFVDGDVRTGKFTATAVMRDNFSPTWNVDYALSHKWLVRWSLDGDVQSHSVIPLNTTYATVSPIAGTGTFVFDDNGRYADSNRGWTFVSTGRNDFVTTTPVVAAIDGPEMTVINELPGVAADVYDSGATAFVLGGYNIVVYNIGAEQPRYSVGILPSSASRATAAVQPLWTLTDNFAARGDDSSENGIRHNHNTCACAIPSADGSSADLYISSNHGSMAHYRLSYSGKSTTAPQIATPDPDVPVEYYDLTGRSVANPTLPGVYLRRQGSTTTKILIP